MSSKDTKTLMSNGNKNGGNKNGGMMPRLRFPEFREAENWRQESLGTLARRSTVKNTTGEHKRVLTNSAEFGVVDQRDYFEKDIATQGNLEGYYLVEKGDYVYNPRISTSAPVGPISKNNVGTGVISPLYTVFRFVSGDNNFFAHYFKSTHWHYYMHQASSTGARHDRMSITNDDFMGLPLPVSTPKEQQKITDCLSSLDELIAAEYQKLKALKVHKQSLMQQLFPRAGEIMPRLRLPEFRDAEAWVEKPLGEIAEIKLGKMLDSKKHTKGKLFPYLNNLAVRWHNVDTSNLPKMYFDVDELDRFGLRAGDVVVCEGGEPGRSAVWDGRLADLKFQKAIHRVRFNIPFEPLFLVLYLELIAGTPRLENLFTGGGIKHLTREAFAQLKIPLASHAEQKCIADCLSSLEGLIRGQSQKIDAFKTFKLGLMQQLFPLPDEVQA